MLIQPDSYIRLIKNCPLDSGYKDTLYFSSREAQVIYFKNELEGIPLTKQSYQRYDKGVLHVEVKADDLYKCNYLMFQNTAFGDKWFYAFINSVEYVNNVSSRVYYEIDILQTWLLDLTIYPCFIDRQHTPTDNIGDNLIPESLDVGEYKAHSQLLWGGRLTNMSVVFEYQGILEGLDKFLGTYTELGKGIYSKVYSKTSYYWFPIVTKESIDNIDSFIDATNILTGGGLLNVFMMPTTAMLYYQGQVDDPNNDYNASDPIDHLVIPRPSEYMDGHKVKNNKLFTYPYCCVNVCGDTDSGKDFAFESFYYVGEDEGKATFYINCPLEQNASVIAYPTQYLGKLFPTEYAVKTAPYPLCRYVTDKVVDWYANNCYSILGNSIAALVSMYCGGSGALSVDTAKKFFDEHPVLDESLENDVTVPQRLRQNSEINRAAREGVLNSLRSGSGGNSNANIGGAINNALSALHHKNVSSNGGGSGVFSTVRGGGITVTIKTLRNYAAKMIDDYFTMYGYAIKSINMPQFNARESFTYIKTIGFSAHGGAPSSVIRDICKIHDSGITYWNPYKTVGDYSQSNKPISEVQNDG